jgi:peptide/nickel transport system substrate-binding protein
MGAKLRVLVVVLSLLAVAGCGGDESGNGGSDGGSPARGEEQEGGVLRMGTTTELDSLNPWVQVSFESSIVSRAAYPSLVQYDAEGEVIPSLAESWESTNGDRVWTFKLKPAKWSDGTALTSEDVRWNLDIQMKYAEGSLAFLAFHVEGMEKVEAPDPTTVVITYEKPLGPIFDLLSRIQIVPKHIWEPEEGSDGKGITQFDPAASTPMVSGGPYIPTRFEPRGTSVLEKNPDYFGDDKPNADTIAIRAFTNPESLTQAVLAGELDYVNSLPPQAAETVENAGEFTVDAVPGVETVTLSINSSAEKAKHAELLEDPVRQAFELVVDRQEIADVAYSGLAKPASSFMAEFSPWSNRDIETLSYDPAEANRLLDEAGYELGSDGIRTTPDGEPMEYEMLVNRDVRGVNRVLDILRNGFEEIGVTFEARLLDAAALDKRVLYPTVDFDLLVWPSFTGPDPEFRASSLVCETPFSAGYCNEEYDRLHAEEASTVDPEARREIILEMQQIAYDAKVRIEIATIDLVTARKPEWDGFVPFLLGRANTFITSPHMVG